MVSIMEGFVIGKPVHALIVGSKESWWWTTLMQAFKAKGMNSAPKPMFTHLLDRM